MNLINADLSLTPAYPSAFSFMNKMSGVNPNLLLCRMDGNNFNQTMLEQPIGNNFQMLYYPQIADQHNTNNLSSLNLTLINIGENQFILLTPTNNTYNNVYQDNQPTDLSFNGVNFNSHITPSPVVSERPKNMLPPISSMSDKLMCVNQNQFYNPTSDFVDSTNFEIDKYELSNSIVTPLNNNDSSRPSNVLDTDNTNYNVLSNGFSVASNYGNALSDINDNIDIKPEISVSDSKFNDDLTSERNACSVTETLDDTFLESSDSCQNDNSEFDDLNTKDLAVRISAELKRYSIPQAVFAQRVLSRSQGTLSDLLRNPKPWSKLKSGRETFRRMSKWLQEPENNRLSFLKLGAGSVSSNTTCANITSATPATTVSPPSVTPTISTTNNHSLKRKEDGQSVITNPPSTASSCSSPLFGGGSTINNPPFISTPAAHSIITTIATVANTTTTTPPSNSSTSSTSVTGSKKPRLVFTDIQRRTLHAIFKETKRPSKDMQTTIANQLQLDVSTVANFFMNARRRSLDKWQEDPPTTQSNYAGCNTPTLSTNKLADHDSCSFTGSFTEQCFHNQNQSSATDHLHHNLDNMDSDLVDQFSNDVSPLLDFMKCPSNASSQCDAVCDDVIHTPLTNDITGTGGGVGGRVVDNSFLNSSSPGIFDDDDDNEDDVASRESASRHVDSLLSDQHPSPLTHHNPHDDDDDELLTVSHCISASPLPVDDHTTSHMYFKSSAAISPLSHISPDSSPGVMVSNHCCDVGDDDTSSLFMTHKCPVDDFCRDYHGHVVDDVDDDPFLHFTG